MLDEHSTSEDVKHLAEICRDQNTVLVSDCGTPGFCDPGFQVVELCRKQGTQIQSSLGASSLMGLLSLSSKRLYQFYFRGFIPAETVAREKEWQTLKKFKEPFILMDTPYRLQKMLDECSLHLKDRQILIALNLSQENELVLEGKPDEIRNKIPFDKAEFMILVYA